MRIFISLFHSSPSPHSSAFGLQNPDYFLRRRPPLMAAALGSASSLPRSLRTEASPPVVSRRSPASAPICSRSLNSRALVSMRAASFNPRCEVVSENFVRKNEINSISSGPSPLELLKSSAADRYTKERSSIMVIGLNIHTAPVEIREKLAIPEAQWPQAITELCALNHIEEAAVLSTCNRMEIYVVALSQHRGVKEVTEWMSKQSGVSLAELCEHQFLLYNKDASQHLFEVTAGLDSLVLGEGQILAQVRQVVKLGQGVAGFDRKISGLFKQAITVGKRVRTETNISSGSVSVSSAAVELALLKLPESSFANSRVVVYGAGKMGKLVIKHLVAKGCNRMVVVNRTEERVNAISQELQGVDIVYRPLSETLACAAEGDVIFTCTSFESPLFTKENVQMLPPVDQGMGRRLFIDISVPRNVEPGVSDLDTAQLYNVDDLEEVVAANKEDRLQKASEAREIILQESNKFEALTDSLETVPTIKKFRAYVERIRASEMEKCLSKMGGDISKKQKEAVYDLSMSIVKKLLHGPVQHLRCEGNDDRSLSEVLKNMRALNRMFDLETEASLLEEKIKVKMERRKK